MSNQSLPVSSFSESDSASTFSSSVSHCASASVTDLTVGGLKIYDYFMIPERTGHNYRWTCAVRGCNFGKRQSPVCGFGTSDLVDHLASCHRNTSGVVDAVREWVAQSRGNNKRKLEGIDLREPKDLILFVEARKKLKSSHCDASQPALPFLDATKSNIATINMAAAQVIISNNYPLNHFDNITNRQFIDAVALIARSTTKSVVVSSLLQTRKMITEKWVPQVAENLFTMASKPLHKLATITGCSLLQVCFSSDSDESVRL
jgi:hypothetical protein